MKKNTIITLIITLALLLSNLSAVFADDGSVEPSEPQDTKVAETTPVESAKPEKTGEPQQKSAESNAAPAKEEQKQAESENTPESEKKGVPQENSEINETPSTNDTIEIFQDNENTEKIDLTNTEAPENMELGGDAEMTGDGEIDPEGDGWLRLTGDRSYELGYAVYDQELKTENGLAFQFDYTAWGGSGADGITFFLMDGKTTMEEFNPGGYGGSLGYAPRYKTVEGLSNAVVGVGIDEFGNFSDGGEGRNGGDGRTVDSVSVRGPGDEFEGYEFVEGTERLQEGVDITHSDERPDQTGEDYRNVSMTFIPIERQFSLTLSMQFGAQSEPTQLFKDLLIPGIIPDTVKFGFTGASGGATNIHEIRNLVVDKAVLNDVIEETVADDGMEEETKKSSSANNTSKNTISVPVTAVVSGDTLIVIPVTGSGLYPLSCEAQSRLEIEDEVYAVLPALCGQEASLVLEPVDMILFDLPAGYSFLNASTLHIINGVTLEPYDGNGTEIEVGFYIDADQEPENLAILVWQEGEWVEQEVVIEDGIISTIVMEGTLFVLAQK